MNMFQEGLEKHVDTKSKICFLEKMQKMKNVNSFLAVQKLENGFGKSERLTTYWLKAFFV